MTETTVTHKRDTDQSLDPYLERILRQQVADWRDGQYTSPRRYVARLGTTEGRAEALLELVHQEMILRRRSREPLRREDYVAEYPELAPAISQLFELHGEISLSRQFRSASGNLEPGVESRPTDALRVLPEIAGYTVEQVLGTGGMGIVYLAEDLALKRKVAVKVVSRGFKDDPEHRARFEREAAAAARFQHPYLVQVFHFGEHLGERYLALEYVEGGTLAKALAGVPQPVRRAATLVEKLARAIEHAHSRGVIHRDLKPANVLMTIDGEPKITDFGLARFEDSSSRTELGALVGTLAYMAPEQVESRAKQIGPRTDIHALGAILYEALTGRPPYRAQTPQQFLHAILSEQIPSPCSLRIDIPRDLESICLRCLEKRPADRYASAADLADDLRRFLDGRPTLARPVHLTVRLWRWCQRNPWAAAFLASLVICVIVLGTMAQVQARANQQLTEAQLKTQQALTATSEAKSETDKALEHSEESRKQTDAVVKFLVDVFSSPDPQQDGRAVKVADVLERARAELDREFAGSQPIKGALFNVLGLTYQGLGICDQAVAMHRKAWEAREAALGRDNDLTLGSRANLANAYGAAGRVSEAIALEESTLQLMQAKLGAEHPDTLVVRSDLANLYREAGRVSEAIALDEPTFELRKAKLGSDHSDTLKSRNNLALDYFTDGRFSDAIALQEPTVRLFEARHGPDDPTTLMCRVNLASLYEAAGRLTDAITLYEVNLKLLELSKMGPNHPITLATRHNLANAYRLAGRLSDAIALMEPTPNLMEAALGADHPYTLESRSKLAQVYESFGRWLEAEALLRDVLLHRKKSVKSDSPLVAADLSQLAANLLYQRRWLEAEPLVREASAIWEKATPDAWDRYHAMSLLGESLLGQGRYAEAERLVVDGYEKLKTSEARIPVPMRSCLLRAAVRVVQLFEGWNRLDEASAWKKKVGLPDLPALVWSDSQGLRKP
jgi:eukaryotic-like serine/threonine-protein kinase